MGIEDQRRKHRQYLRAIDHDALVEQLAAAVAVAEFPHPADRLVVERDVRDIIETVLLEKVIDLRDLHGDVAKTIREVCETDARNPDVRTVLELLRKRASAVVPAELTAAMLAQIDEAMPSDPWSTRVAGQELSAEGYNRRATAMTGGTSLPRPVESTSEVLAFVVAALLADRLATDGYRDPRDPEDPSEPIEPTWSLPADD